MGKSEATVAVLALKRAHGLRQQGLGGGLLAYWLGYILLATGRIGPVTALALWLLGLLIMLLPSDQA